MIVVPIDTLLLMLTAQVDLVFEGEDVALVGLFSNDVSPILDFSPGDFVEDFWSAYARIPLDSPVFNLVDGDTTYEALFPQVQWENEESDTFEAFGYFVVSNDGLTLWWAERFAAAPWVIDPSPDGTVQFSPRLTLRNQID